jgi:hypothetical protein
LIISGGLLTSTVQRTLFPYFDQLPVYQRAAAPLEAAGTSIR